MHIFYSVYIGKPNEDKQLLRYDFCDVEHFAALKRDGVIIRGDAIFEGNTINAIKVQSCLRPMHT